MMKKLVYIFLGALVIFMAGCSKDNSAVRPDPDAWMYDVSLPVPIRFSAGDVSTKAAIEDTAALNGRGFAFVVIDKKSDDFTAELDIDFPGVGRNSAKALCKNTGGGKYMFTFYKPHSTQYSDSTPMTYFYPMQTEECYSFYAYHCSRTTKDAYHDHPKVVREKDLIYTDIPVADSCDVLWGVAEATPETTSQGVVDGYNAKYMRKIGTHPSISFKHCTACLNFTLKRRDGDTTDVLVCKRAYLDSIDTKARLYILDRNGTKTGTLERITGAAKSKAMVDTQSDSLTYSEPTQLEEIFIMPQSEAIELVLEFEVTDRGTSTTSAMSVKYTIDPTVYGLPDGFEAGKRYRFNMVVYSPEEVSIFADVDKYENGFDNVPEIDPDASGQ